MIEQTVSILRILETDSKPRLLRTVYKPCILQTVSRLRILPFLFLHYPISKNTFLFHPHIRSCFTISCHGDLVLYSIGGYKYCEKSQMENYIIICQFRKYLMCQLDQPDLLTEGKSVPWAGGT